MSRLIDEDAAIEALREEDPNCGVDAEWIIRKLPSAQPETTLHITKIKKHVSDFSDLDEEPGRKTGKWIIPVPRGDVITYSRAYWECDQCHKAIYFGNDMKFCPNCGADMRGEDNG